MTTDFTQRWHRLAEQARHVSADATTEAPFGFTTRTLTRMREMPAEPWSDILAAFALRAAVITTCLLVGGTGFAVAQWYEFRIEPPALENVIPSELTWP